MEFEKLGVTGKLVAIAELLECTADINGENVAEATLLLERVIRQLDAHAFERKTEAMA